METWDAIRARRNVRTYTDQALARGDLERVLEAGRRAPSASNSQPWDFVVVSDREQLQELANVWQGAWHVAASAATIALLAPRPENEGAGQLVQYDLGQATANMMIAASDLGIGSAHAAVTDQELAQRLLVFPDDRYCAYLIALGVPADAPLEPILKPDRRAFEDVVHWGSW